MAKDDYQKGIEKGSIYSKSYRPPGGTIAEKEANRRAADEARRRNESNQRWSDSISSLERNARKGSSSSSGAKTKEGCFVATAACGNYDAPEVLRLRSFRDETLASTAVGRCLIGFYYIVSPSLAAIIVKSEFLRKVVRQVFLRPIVFGLSRNR